MKLENVKGNKVDSERQIFACFLLNIESTQANEEVYAKQGGVMKGEIRGSNIV